VITFEFEIARLRGAHVGIYGLPGRYKLWAEPRAGHSTDEEEDALGDPALEGDDARELDERARAVGALTVTHWYRP
jgi:hypothetical protein